MVMTSLIETPIPDLQLIMNIMRRIPFNQGENTVIEFTYISKCSHRDYGDFPYRVGDLVKVHNWGSSYSTYPDAYRYFGLKNQDGSVKTPFYANLSESRCCRKQDRIFKIIDIAEHGTFHDRILFLIKDNQNQEAVVDNEGIKPFKTFPLRDNENKIVEINRIQHERN
jgi:hypothetical protein